MMPLETSESKTRKPLNTHPNPSDSLRDRKNGEDLRYEFVGKIQEILTWPNYFNN
jgi:hypothetical protein